MNDNELIALLDEVETRRAAVTDAPWWANIHAQVFSVDNQSGKGHAVAECVHDDVANFIAHAPTDISTLSAALRQRLTKEQGDEAKTSLLSLEGLGKTSTGLLPCPKCQGDRALAVDYLKSISVATDEERVLLAEFLATKPTVTQIWLTTSLCLAQRATQPTGLAWLPIETAPKGSVPVLLGSTECELVQDGYAESGVTLCTDGHKPNRWMPLPDPPTQATASAFGAFSNGTVAGVGLNEPESNSELLKMLALRKELDPEAPDAVVLPSSVICPDCRHATSDGRSCKERPSVLCDHECVFTITSTVEEKS